MEELVSGQQADSTTVDSAAASIFALLQGENKQPDPEPAPVAAQSEHEPEPAPSEPEPEQNTSEQAPEGGNDAASAQPEQPQEQPTQAPTAPQPVTQAQPPANPDPNAAARNTQLAQLNQLVPQLQGQLAAMFPDIKSFDDLARVANEDPARAVAYQVQAGRVQEAARAQAALAAQSRADWERAEAQKLEKLLPEIADPQKGPELKAKLAKFAKEQNYTDHQIAQFSSNDVKLLHDAMLHRDSVAQRVTAEKAKAEELKAAKAKAAAAPPVQKPGTVHQNSKGEAAREDLARLKKTGSIDDAARAFRHIL